ncbi:aminopeptidase [Halorussus salinisoli]|uniref:aminopeptidase n=1 Tax=Halorussus salinisoli TaxID=2558242 RepID=UPI0010C24146|nr:aminopeptidase [Halorussus salinisoli]
MDPRIRTHADILVDHCTDLDPSDDVLVRAPPAAEDLAVAVAERIGEVGANPSISLQSERATRAYLRASDAEDFETPEHLLAMTEAADAFVLIKGDRNTAELSDVPTETLAAFRRARRPVSEARMGKRWVGTQFPASGNAQKAEMSTEEYEAFVYDAIDKDWDAQKDHQQQMVEILDPAEEVRVVSGDTTDLRMSVAGMKAVNDYGEKNLPGGEVFTAPVPDSVEGEVLFDKPLLRHGREIQDAYLRFEGGEVVAHDASKNADLLASILDTDEGARRLGELGIGMNRDIDRFTYNVLFDEKMGDTVHLAVGKAIEETVPEGQPLNESAVHTDMIVDMSDDSFIEVDGEIVQRDGTFRFEDGFEG